MSVRRLHPVLSIRAGEKAFRGQGRTLVLLLAPVHTVTRTPADDGPPWDWKQNPDAR